MCPFSGQMQCTDLHAPREAIPEHTCLDRLASISQRIDLIKDNAVVLVALVHVCSHSGIDELAELLQDDLPQQHANVVMQLVNVSERSWCQSC